MERIDRLLDNFYGKSLHPYLVYENKIASQLSGNEVILDAGCGRGAPVLRKFIGKTKCCIGVDLEKCHEMEPGLQYIQGDIANINIEDNSVDIVISRAVLEHIEKPLSVYVEINRILKPNGRFIFLVPNLGDYVSICSLLIPNKYHGTIVSKMEGRETHDVFPVYYKSNTYLAIKRLTKLSGFKIQDFRYVSQYPSMFTFNHVLFLIATIYEKVISKFDALRFYRAWILADLKKIR